MKNAISRESAAAQVKTFLDFYEIKNEDIEKTEKDNKLEPVVEKLTQQIMAAHLEIVEEKGTLKVTQNLKIAPGELKQISYDILGGKNKVAMRDKGVNDFYGRSYAMMGSLCGLGETAILNLKGVDLSVVETLGALYLNV